MTQTGVHALTAMLVSKPSNDPSTSAALVEDLIASFSRGEISSAALKVRFPDGSSELVAVRCARGKDSSEAVHALQAVLRRLRPAGPA